MPHVLRNHMVFELRVPLSTLQPITLSFGLLLHIASAH